LERVVRKARLAKPRVRGQALLWLDAGMAIQEVADLLGVHRQTVSRWRDEFFARSDLSFSERLLDAPRTGRPRAGGGQMEALIDEVIDLDPRRLGYRATTWTASLLCDHLEAAPQIEVSRKTVSRTLDRLGLRWKRPRHRLASRSATWRQAKGG
jgi:transposase